MKKKEAEYQLKPRFLKVSESISGYGTQISLLLLFALSFVYFQWFGNGIFFHQENNSLFIYSFDYLAKYLSRPGGLLVYAGNFLTQGYFSTIYGSLVNSILFILICLILRSVLNLFTQKDSKGIFLIILLPLALLICQANYNYYIFHTLGFLSVALWFRASIAIKRIEVRIILLLLFPLFYYIAGTFALVYLGMYFMYCGLFENGKERYVFPLIQLAVSILTLVLFYKVLFLQPLKTILDYPLIINDYSIYTIPLLIAGSLFVIYPLFIRLSVILRYKRIEGYLVPVTILSFFPATVLFLLWQNNPVLEGIMKTERMFINGQTDKVILCIEKYSAPNIIEQFYYNLALSEKDQLCSRMFFSRQSSGPMSLSLEGNREQASRTIHYYYTIGLINEARHLAFELMVRNGYTPENIKMLIRTELINGNFRPAERYLGVLKKTLKYRNWAGKYEKYLFNPELVKADPELGEKIKLMPQSDFFIVPGEARNIDQLIKSNHLNRKAFEYKMARLLLEKDLIAVEEEVKNMKSMGYTSFPRHIDEAIVAYRNFAKAVPDLGGLSTDPETGKRFSGYAQVVNDLKGNKSLIEASMKKTEKNTFWYYLQFGTISGEFMRSKPVDRSIY
ncbi:MAG: hypothetical protein A2X04_08610 [Bacteroidetes bacterium GWF2_41_9]|nr:MAG: hypothetical protein A2X06_03635 [Bacteroidetes bacterium GWC2_40_22]OFY60573.1 MAG: hypothetical protein A2X04_08610 [Bacteroidetes bacterium GWF2_41_9]HAM08964.1 hypothetical protein [Bacteroidales bacterium]HBH85163.1 hypothetical protein [Bacteroidales bacterium]